MKQFLYFCTRCLFVWVFDCCFISSTRIFHSEGNVTIVGVQGLKNSDLCLELTDFEVSFPGGDLSFEYCCCCRCHWTWTFTLSYSSLGPTCGNQSQKWRKHYLKPKKFFLPLLLVSLNLKYYMTEIVFSLTTKEPFWD